MTEPEVKRLAIGESRQYDEKGDPIRHPRSQRWKGMKNLVAWRPRTITYGKNGPEYDVYTGHDE